MWADAIRAETYRLSKNRGLLFWSILFVPVMGVILAAIGAVVADQNRDKLADVGGEAGQAIQAMIAPGPIVLGEAMVAGAAGAANPGVLLFTLIAAATLFAGDYRWETWRLISARNARPNLVAGKVATLGLVVLAALGGVLVSGVAETVIQASVFDRAITAPADGGDAGRFATLVGLSWWRVMQFALVALLAAVATRSLLAALFAPLVIGIGTAFSPQILTQMSIAPDGWFGVLCNPGGGFEMLAAALRGGAPAAGLPDQAVAKGLASLALWTLAPLAAALAWFQRQDLSKE